MGETPAGEPGKQVEICNNASHRFAPPSACVTLKLGADGAYQQEGASNAGLSLDSQIDEQKSEISKSIGRLLFGEPVKEDKANTFTEGEIRSVHAAADAFATANGGADSRIPPFDVTGSVPPSSPQGSTAASPNNAPGQGALIQDSINKSIDDALTEAVTIADRVQTTPSNSSASLANPTANYAGIVGDTTANISSANIQSAGSALSMISSHTSSSSSIQQSPQNSGATPPADLMAMQKKLVAAECGDKDSASACASTRKTLDLMQKSNVAH